MGLKLEEYLKLRLRVELSLKVRDFKSSLFKIRLWNFQLSDEDFFTFARLFLKFRG